MKNLLKGRGRLHRFFWTLCLMLTIGAPAILNGGMKGLNTGTAGSITSLAPSAYAFSKSAEIEADYRLGDTLRIPSASFDYQGKNHEASSVLHFPSGTVKKLSEITFTEPGRYSVEYIALVDGGAKTLSESTPFLVWDRKYTVSNPEKSSVHYGQSPYITTQTGAVVSLAQGDSFIYNKPINLKNKLSSDKIITIAFTPAVREEFEAMRLLITLTDAYNPNNSITIIVKGDKSQLSRSYVSAGADNVQPQIGLHPWSDSYTANKAVVGGVSYRKQVNDNYGALFGSLSMTAREGSRNEFSVRMNYAERKVYLEAGGTVTLVSDLDEPVLYGGDLWNGFRADEALISVSAALYEKGKYNFVVKDIAGESMSGEDFLNSAGPEIKVDFNGYSEHDLPEALVGKGYPVFAATAQDYIGNCKVDAYVFFNYAQEEFRTTVSIKNNRFEVKYRGAYTIVYKARNSRGFESVKLVNISAIKSSVTLTASLAESPPARNILAGETVTVPGLDVTSFYGDKYSVSITGKHNSNAASSYEISTVDLLFRPLYAGVYTVTYTVTDLSETITESFNLTVVANPAPALTGTVTLPKYIIKNQQTPLPIMASHSFAGGSPVAAETGIKVREYTAAAPGGVDRSLSGNLLTTAADSVKIIYYTQNAHGGDSVISNEIPVIDVGWGGILNLAKYFYYPDGRFDTDRQGSYIEFATDVDKAGGETAEMEFINALHKNVSLNFGVNPGKNDFTQARIYLTDFVDSDVSVRFNFIKDNAAGSFFTINESNFKYRIEGSNFFSVTSSFGIDYNDDKQEVLFAERMRAVITEDLSGRPFSGFRSGKVYVRIELDGITSDAAIRIRQIGNQWFNGMGEDLSAPTIYHEGFPRRCEFGTRFLINSVTAMDVLDPYTTITLRITGPDGVIVKSADGISLDNILYSGEEIYIGLNQYGNYSISFTAKDSSGNPRPYNSTITIPDLTPPEIRLSGIVNEGKTGERIPIAKAECSDNLSTEITLIVCIETPDGRIIAFKDECLITSLAGIYYVHYYALDEADNAAYERYAINVV